MSLQASVLPNWPEPAHLEDDASATVALVQTHLSGFSPQFEFNMHHHWWSFSLPRPSDGEYQFTLHGELGGERQISAIPMHWAKDERRRRFWYSALEIAGFRNDATALEKSFHESVTALLTHPTRIIEKKGIV